MHFTQSGHYVSTGVRSRATSSPYTDTHIDEYNTEGGILTVALSTLTHLYLLSAATSTSTPSGNTNVHSSSTIVSYYTNILAASITMHLVVAV